MSPIGFAYCLLADFSKTYPKAPWPDAHREAVLYIDRLTWIALYGPLVERSKKVLSRKPKP